MAGYSGTPLPMKLGIKEGHEVAFPRAPEDFAETLGELPELVHVKERTVGPLDVIVAFFTRRADLEKRVGALIRALDPDGGLWIAWPKKSSGIDADITEDTLREVFLPLGLVDNKVCAIDDIWSGLRLVHRLENRAALRG